MSPAEERLAREIERHREIAEQVDIIWNWDSPSGRRRADRRASIFVEHRGLAPGRRVLELGCGTGPPAPRVVTARGACYFRHAR